MAITIRLEGLPVPLNNMYTPRRDGRGRAKTSKARNISRAWTLAAQQQIAEAKVWLPPAREDRLRVDVRLYSPRWITRQGLPSMSAGDIDGRAKHAIDAVFTALPGCVDDCQVMELRMEKLHSADEYTVVTIDILDTTDFSG